MSRRTRRAVPKHADPEEVATIAEGMNRAWLWCRTYGHSWGNSTARWNAEDGTFEVTLRCSRCKSTNPFVATGSGEVVRRGRTYPPGYLLHGVGRIVGSGRDALRRETFRRMVPGGDH